MGRALRWLPPTGSLVEVTVRTIQGRYLLRPSPQSNRLVVGVLAHAQAATAMSVHAVVVMSNHIHLLVSPTTTRQLADFMRRVNGDLSREIGRLHDWPGTIFPRRYTSIPVSEEPQAQIARLRYLLAHGCKEGLVPTPVDWPGVHAARAICDGRSLQGVWVDRTAWFKARQRGEDVTEADFSEIVELAFDPLPCWQHLDSGKYRERVAGMVDEIERETLARHRRDRTVPRGSTWVCRRHPHERPRSIESSPKPRFHVVARRLRDRLVAAYREFLAAYRIAAERLANGDTSVTFPDNCYPPRLPFVEPSRLEPS